MASGLSEQRLARVRALLQRHVDEGHLPGGVAVVARRGAVHLDAVGTLAFDGVGARTAIAGDTICRLASMSKPLVAACAMALVEDGTLRLDDPVEGFLPELAEMRVLRHPAADLDDTVPARRPITLRDLLTFRLGIGMVMVESPIADALHALDALDPPPGPDDYLRRLGELPLVHQPGESWMYEIAADVTGVLIARATGTSFDTALRARVCEPIGMVDTGFSVRPQSLDRFATAYDTDAATGELVVADRPDGRFSRPPAFETGGGGLVSTTDDYLAFATAMLAGGVVRGRRILSRPAVTLMTTNHLTPAQLALSGFAPDYFDDIGWGFGMSVRTRRTQLGPSVGSYGWPGYYGTAWYNDPVEDLTMILMIQRAFSAEIASLRTDFATAVYQAIDD